jgi:hypothetical protein
MTTKQKQCLLEYLGYYDPDNSNKVNNVDGIWGPASMEATRKFQKEYGLEIDGIFGAATEKKIRSVVYTGQAPQVNWDETEYFERDEFRCKCGGKYCKGFPAEPKVALIRVAERVRKHFGRPVIVSSGVRCKIHNKNVGGVATSRHMTGSAMDFCVSGKKAAEVLAYVQKQPEIRYAYAIDSNYVHMDVG